MSKFAKKAEAPSEVTKEKPAKMTVKVKMPDKPAKPTAKAAVKEKTTDTRKITVVAKENPKREGSAAHGRFELYSKNKTVDAFIAAGGSMADVKFDEKAGHIKVG